MTLTRSTTDLTRDRQATDDLQPRVPDATVPHDFASWVQTDLRPLVDALLKPRTPKGEARQALLGRDEVIVKVGRGGRICIRCRYLAVVKALRAIYDPEHYEIKVKLFKDGHHFWDDLPSRARHPRPTILEHPLRTITITQL